VMHHRISEERQGWRHSPKSVTMVVSLRRPNLDKKQGGGLDGGRVGRFEEGRNDRKVSEGGIGSL
jgi:hypothetical protein